jgi:P-type Cu+ transporter
MHIELPITGMTCASCAARVERSLNEVEGVSATVNYATERATVDYDPATVEPAQLVNAVEAVGYGAVLRPREDARAAPGSTSSLRLRVAVSAALSLPVLLLWMIPPLRFDGWEWVAFALATPVVLWGALPLHRATRANLKHRTATMDTLVSVGVLAAWGWSVYALIAPDTDMYFETASVITTFILAGRFFEARPSAGPARHSARCSSSAPRRSRSWTPAARSGACPWRSSCPATASSCARARRWPPTAWSTRAPRPST